MAATQDPHLPSVAPASGPADGNLDGASRPLARTPRTHRGPWSLALVALVASLVACLLALAPTPAASAGGSPRGQAPAPDDQGATAVLGPVLSCERTAAGDAAIVAVPPRELVEGIDYVCTREPFAGSLEDVYGCKDDCDTSRPWSALVIVAGRDGARAAALAALAAPTTAVPDR